MKKIAIVLAGCGVYDGSEIHESVLTMLEIERNGACYECLAPNIEQAHVINHLTGEASNEVRNVMVEAARIARGLIVNLAEADVNNYDALIFPGGFGAAKNLCDFAFKGADCDVNENVLSFARKMSAAGKPLGFICISPVMIPKIYGEGVRLTIGIDEETAKATEAMGGIHISCPVSDFVVDESRKVVSTPAYMLAGSISEAHAGISRLVEEVIRLA